MGQPLDERYLKWLYSQVASIEVATPANSYWTLLRELFTTEFVWLVANDDNRLEDGRDLRYEFIADAGIESPDEDWMTIGCSMLEMLIGLSRRLVFASETEMDVSVWFWHLLNNIHLAGFNDSYFRTERQRDYVSQILESVVYRNYRSDGVGGLFPLRDAKEDQRGVELWYQLSNYLMEGHTA